MKKKFIKNVTIFLSALFITQTILSGCSMNSSKVSSVDKKVLKNDSVKNSPQMNKEGLPIVDKDSYQFSLFVDNRTPLDNQFVWPMLEEQTNIKVDVQQYPYEIAKEKYGLALSSGDYTDVIGGWCISPTDILTYGVNMGIFIPLEDYFEKYAPNIMEVLEMPGVRETMTAPDGHIYAIPFVSKSPKVHFNPYINQKWLDNLGLKMPTNTEELREVLHKFKTEDANGNGNPNDEIPFSADPNNKHLGLLAGWFGLPIDSSGFTMIDGKLEFGANREEYKQFIEYMASLNSEGLLDKELFTQDLATWKGKGEQDLYGVSIAYWSADFKKIPLNEVPDFKPLPVLKSPQCDEPKWLAFTTGIQTLKSQAVITDKAKNPEIIVRWWDNLYEVDNSFQAKNGPFGKTCEKIGENHYKLYDKSKLSDEDNDKYSFDNIFCQALPTNIPPDLKLDKETPDLYDEKKDTDELYEPYFVDGVIEDFWVPSEYSAKFAEYSKSITDYINQKTAAWISGQADVNKEWNDYCKQLEKLGLQEYIKIRKEVIGQI